MARLTEALRPPAVGPGNGGPSGPNGGSRSYGPSDDAAAEPVRERVSAVRDEPAEADAADDSEPAETPVMSAPVEPVEMHAVEEPEEKADDVPQAEAHEVARPEADEVPHAAAERDDVMATPTSTWVDPPSDDAREEPVAAAATQADADHGSRADEAMDATDDDDALLSTTTQLRRVAEIDWHDLPSVSNG